MSLTNLPVIGSTYNSFDDGKIRESRKYSVVIESITPFVEAPSNLTEAWLKWAEEVVQCHWLYNPITDYFITASVDDGTTTVYVRITDNRWFALGDGPGLLDVDGSLLASLP